MGRGRRRGFCRRGAAVGQKGGEQARTEGRAHHRTVGVACGMGYVVGSVLARCRLRKVWEGAQWGGLWRNGREPAWGEPAAEVGLEEESARIAREEELVRQLKGRLVGGRRDGRWQRSVPVAAHDGLTQAPLCASVGGATYQRWSERVRAGKERGTAETRSSITCGPHPSL